MGRSGREIPHCHMHIATCTLPHSTCHTQADNWSSLHAAAWELEERRLHEGLEYTDMSASEVKTIVSYVFRARKAKGVSEHI